MEHHKRHHQYRSPQRNQKQKAQFFKQVFQQCEQKFSSKQFEFFVKCMIPNRAHNNRTSSANKKINNLTSYQQKQTDINDINPNVLTMPRKLNFYEEKGISNLKLQRKNKRLLTTPTQRIQRQLRFNNFQDFTLYKRMQNHQDNLAQNLKESGIVQKMYSPEPLFYPNCGNQAAVLKLRRGKLSSKRKMKNEYQMRFKCDDQTGKENSECIPGNFIEIVRQSSNKSFRCSKTSYIKFIKF